MLILLKSSYAIKNMQFFKNTYLKKNVYFIASCVA